MRLATRILFAALFPMVLLGILNAVAKKKLPFVHFTQIDTQNGRSLFDARCARCHNLESSPFLKFGPNLHQVAERVETLDTPMEPATYVLVSMLNPDAFRAPGYGVMPKNLVSDLPDQDIKDLVAYILGDRHFATILAMPIPAREQRPPSVAITRAEAELGEHVFREKGACVRCHSYYQAPEYHTLAPNLFQAGYRDIDYIRLSIKQPSHAVMDEFKTTVVELADGRTMSGRRVHSPDPDRVALLTTDVQGNLLPVSIANQDIQYEDGRPSIQLLNKSAMPDDYVKLLTPAEIDAVATMILSLNE
jgi:cytochrome c2